MKNDSSIDYDGISRIYDVGRAAKPEMVKRLIRLLQVDENSNLLDLGCGTGNYTAALQKKAKKVIGIDKSQGMIEKAQAKLPNIQFICADVTDLPFGSETFDGAFAIQVIHHIRDKELFLKEAHRVLKKGGYFAIDTCSHKQMQAFWYYYYFPKGLEKDLARIPDTKEIVSMLKKAGFSNIRIKISYVDVAVDHDQPKRYLDKNYRDGISTFALLSEEEIEAGCEKLQKDIASGAAEKIVRKFEARSKKQGNSSVIHARKS